MQHRMKLSMRTVATLLTASIVLSGCHRQSQPDTSSAPPSPANDEQLEQEINVGRSFLDQGDAAEALKQFDQVLAAHPDSAAAHAARADALGRLNKPDQVLAEISRAIALDPQNQQYRRSRANNYLLQGKLREALADCDELINRPVVDPSAYALRASIYLRMERYDDALNDANRCIALKPNSGSAFAVRGRVHLVQQAYRPAIRDFDKALELNVDSADSYLNRGLANQALGLNEDAIADYGNAIRLRPDDVISRYDRAMLNAKLGHLSEAIEDFTVGIDKLEPEKPAADSSAARFLARFYVKRAATFGQQASFQRAVADCTAALLLQPKNVNALRIRSLAYRKLGQPDKATADDEAIQALHR